MHSGNSFRCQFSAFVIFSVYEQGKTKNETEQRMKLEQEEYFPFCVLHFGKNQKMYTENSFRFPFLVSVFLRKWNCYFFLFCLPVSDKRRTRKRKLFPHRFRKMGNRKSQIDHVFRFLMFFIPFYRK